MISKAYRLVVIAMICGFITYTLLSLHYHRNAHFNTVILLESFAEFDIKAANRIYDIDTRLTELERINR